MSARNRLGTGTRVKSVNLQNDNGSRRWSPFSVADRSERFDVRHPVNIQRAARLPRLLAHFLYRRGSALRGQVPQMCRRQRWTNGLFHCAKPVGGVCLLKFNAKGKILNCRKSWQFFYLHRWTSVMSYNSKTVIWLDLLDLFLRPLEMWCQLFCLLCLDDQSTCCRTVCEDLQAAGNGTEWRNSKIHFDNVIMGYLALFQVVCLSGIWFLLATARICQTFSAIRDSLWTFSARNNLDLAMIWPETRSMVPLLNRSFRVLYVGDIWRLDGGDGRCCWLGRGKTAEISDAPTIAFSIASSATMSGVAKYQYIFTVCFRWMNSRGEKTPLLRTCSLSSSSLLGPSSRWISSLVSSSTTSTCSRRRYMWASIFTIWDNTQNIWFVVFPPLWMTRKMQQNIFCAGPLNWTKIWKK